MDVILQPPPGSFTAEPSNWDANYFSSTWRVKTDYTNYSRGQQGVEGLLGDTSMDSPDYGIAAMRRGSYDDAATCLRPVSIDPKPKVKKILLVTAECDSVLFQTHESNTCINILQHQLLCVEGRQI